MNRILFVDDEKNVLEGLKRMLYSLRNQWEMDFVSSGAEALQHLAQSSFDVLVTDVQMPEMNGIQLLQEVRRRHPGVIRMVLSGVADLELTLQSVSLSHQYLTKPCDAQTLRATVQRAFCLRALLHNPNLRNLIGQIQSLPSIPMVYGELVRVLRSEDASPSAVGAIMARDMAMTAKVLQLVNSSFFGLSREIANPVDAVVYLGMETVRALMFTAAAFSQFRVRACCEFSIEELQRHSLAVGALARRIARSMDLPPAEFDHAFVGGLLHDIGKLVLASNYPERYQETLRRSRSEPAAVSEVEREIFGTSHAEIGAYLLWLWGLPEPITEILALHHQLLYDPGVSRAVTAVHIANSLVNRELGPGHNLEGLRNAGLDAGLAGWRKMHAEMLEEASC